MAMALSDAVPEYLQRPREANERVAFIVKVLQQYMKPICGLRASEIVKAGSLGQGTAISYEFDLDLVVYSVDIERSDMLDGKLKTYLAKIMDLLSQFLCIFINLKKTKHSVQFEYRDLKVDLLPSPCFDSINEFHEYLETLETFEQRRKFSCSAAKWINKNFFSKQPAEVKKFIRRAKSWRNKKWPSKQNSDGRPKSILISLLVIEAYRRSVSKRPQCGASRRAQSVTDLMKNDIRGHRHLSISWIGNGALFEEKYQEYFPAVPYIIDPSNPFNNIYKSGIGAYKKDSPESTYHPCYPGNGKWENIVKYVDSLDLRKRNGTRYLSQSS